MTSNMLGHILVVDDEAESKDALVEGLRAQGCYAVMGCASSCDALSALREQNFDVLLSDLMMPEMDGVALLRAALEIDRHLVCVIMTGQETRQTADEALKAGAFDYVLKPFKLEALLPLLSRAVYVRRLRQENLQLRETVRSKDESLALLDAILSTAPIGFAFHNRDLVFERVNETLAAINGLPVEQHLGRTLREVLPDLADSLEPLLSRVLETEEPMIDMELKGETPADPGQQHYWLASFFPVRKQGGELLGVGELLVSEITGRKRMEEALRESEDRYRDLVEHSHDLICTHDLDGRILSVNQTAARVLGYPPETLPGRNIRDGLLPKFRDQFDDYIAELQRAGIAHGVMAIQTRSGEKRLWEYTNTLRTEGVVAPIVRGVAHDVTERKKAEAALRKAEEKYRSIFENAVEGIFQSTPGGRFISVNPAMARILGYESSEELMAHRTDIKTQYYVDSNCRAELERMLDEQGVVVGFECEVSRKDLSRIWTSENIRAIRDESGALVCYEGSIKDITERKQTEEMQLRRAAQVALRADVAAALAKSDDALPCILEHCAEALVQHLGAALARIWTLNKDENVLELQAGAGMYTHIDGPLARVPVGTFMIGLIAEKRQPYITNDLQCDSRVGDEDWAEREGMIAFAGYPLIVEERLVGVVAIFARQKLAEDTLDALASVADIISQGIERKRIEEALRESEDQLRQSQKLEAIGQLAGGVAHDFNNLLTVITGYSDLLLKGLSPGEPARLKVEEIKKAGERAAALTRQLLAFSRRQVLQPKVLSLNAIVVNVDRMLRRLIGEDIDLLSVLEPSLGQTKADPGQIEQVILNLAVNSRDAMPQGGKLTIETANVYLDNQYARKHLAIRPGHYVMLAVSDTGCGMSALTQARIFEPFFTTKEQGKGTGLGLPTVYGIVKQSGGNIWVNSEVGCGTTFKIYLPRVDEVVEREEARNLSAELPQGRETVLLVEDEEQVRQITRVILEMNGYRVLEAANGEEALSIYKQHERQLDLVMIDAVLPQMSGRELAQSLETLCPGIKVLFMSGYTDDAIVRHGLLDHEIAFLQKPFTPDTLTRKVREVLDAQRRNGAQEPEA